ncbi:biopolymer transporter ExbD [Geomonas nitrogeniifigens]|uniref:Biopolymer transporter ExbD n=1 Tax=Geomonas diazotrophica TaxID=2843197 RepID=A0ABX8JIH7_9BACT|nr:biopolymer transporter ExbD [Geomonas nitrogeniifigens]QWV96926.1 biopolymer transporter ExbD [Geomonas nitrogeniifigens]QXE86102.1 biopolymer transporter ExbD [Geomonas nitrogeniifigens]
MRESRRLKRLERNNSRRQAFLNLIPMLDVLSVLVFFLLFHSFNGDMPEQRLALPTSVVETKPRGTVVVSVTPEAVVVQGQAVARTADLYDDRVGTVREVTDRLDQIESSLKATGGGVAENETREVTLLADKTIPFKVLKKIMTSCTASGYGKISLAVIQKASHA